MGIRRVLKVNNDREYFKVKCLLLRKMVDNESKRDKLLYDIVSRNVNGVVEDTYRLSVELRHKYELDRKHYSKIIGLFAKQGYLVKQGNSFVVHPLLSDKGDRELLIKV